MDHKLPLSEKHGANPSMGQCFWCRKNTDVTFLHGKLADDAEAPQHLVIDYEPCGECKAVMAQGLTIIEARQQPNTPNQPMMNKDSGAYPTGNWTVVSKEAAVKVLGDAVDPNAVAIFLLPQVYAEIMADPLED